ncbi:MAG: hypothetical protein ABI833_18700, partial [Acidobacteriota bacterium]
MKIAATFLLATWALTAQTPATPKSALDKATLEAYLRYAELWVPQVTVKIDDPKPSATLDGFYDVDVHLTYSGATKDEKKGGELLFRAYRGLPKNSALIKFLSEQGMKVLLQKTENHYLQDQQKEMHKIDQDLLFVIDEKNNTV